MLLGGGLPKGWRDGHVVLVQRLDQRGQGRLGRDVQIHAELRNEVDSLPFALDNERNVSA